MGSEAEEEGQGVLADRIPARPDALVYQAWGGGACWAEHCSLLKRRHRGAWGAQRLSICLWLRA